MATKKFKIKKHGSGYIAYAGGKKITTTVNKPVAKTAISQFKKKEKHQAEYRKKHPKNPG